MTVALGTVLTYGINCAGGWGAVMDNAHSLAGYLSLTASHDPSTGTAVSYGALSIASCMAWGFGYFGMPHILLRFMAIEDEKKLVLSRRIATVWVFIAMAVAIIIGIVGLGMTNAGALSFLEGSSMCTAVRQMVAAASSVSQNVLQDFFHVKLTDKQSLAIARITIAVIAILGVFLARDPDSSVFGIVSFAWAGFGGAFGAVMLCSLFWKRSNKWGALAGMISGGATVFIWKYLVRPLGGAWNIYELLPAFFVSLLFIIVVSLLTAAPDETQIKEFEAAK